MTSNSQSADRSTEEAAKHRAAALTGLARIRRSLRTPNDPDRYASVETAGPIERRGAISGPLTAEQAAFDDDMRAEIARQDANPQAYILPHYTPEQLSERFNAPLKMCRGLDTEA